MNTKKKGSPKGSPSRSRIARLERYAVPLTRILFALTEKKIKDFTSDLLWIAIKSRWTTSDLEKAISAFEKKGTIAAFLSLLREATNECPIADASGFIKLRREQWGCFAALINRLNINGTSIKRRLGGVCSIKGRLSTGAITIFYALSEVRRACSQLLRKMPRAAKDGFFKIKGGWWGTVNAISRRLDLSDRAIKARLRGCRSMKGRQPNGNIETFYSLSDTRRLCSDLLVETPYANQKGVIIAQGQQWCSMKGLSKAFNIGQATVKRYIQRCRSIKGKTPNGVVHAFYSLRDFKKVRSKIPQKVSKADKNGFLHHNGKKWATVRFMSAHLKVGKKNLKAALRGCVCIKGRVKNGNLASYYTVDDIRKACKSSLALPKVGRNGFLTINGQKWGSIPQIAKYTGLSTPTIAKYAEKCTSKKVKDRRGRARLFYSLNQIRRLCKTLLKKVPRVDKDGFLTINGQKWGTKESLGRATKLSTHAVNRLVRGLHSCEGKTRNGMVRKFYSLAEFQKKHAEQSTRADLITSADLRDCAERLTKVLFNLQKSGYKVTSDGLWRRIKKIWKKPMLESALKKKSIKPFKALFSS